MSLADSTLVRPALGGLYVPDAEPSYIANRLGIGMAPQNNLSVWGQADLTFNSSNAVAPQLFFNGKNGGWLVAMDVANNGGSKDFVIVARNDALSGGSGVHDFIYVANNYPNPPTVGFGITPPASGSYTAQFAASDALNSQGDVSLRVGPSQTGHALAVLDSSGNVNLAITAGFRLRGADSGVGNSSGALVLQAASFTDAASQNRCVVYTNSGVTASWGLSFSGSALIMRYHTGAINLWKVDTDSSFTTFGPNNFQNGLTTTGGRALGFQAKSANYSMGATDENIYATGGTSGITITLPAASSNSKRVFLVKKVDSGAGVVTVATAGGNIDGAATVAIANQYSFLKVQSDGANYQVIGKMGT